MNGVVGSMGNAVSQSENLVGYAGQPWLVEERDACGVGFIADQQGRKSHQLIQSALCALGCLEHRGGCSADQDSGDGAGLLSAIPWDIIEQWWTAEKGSGPLPKQVAVGMVFLPQLAAAAAIARDMVEAELKADGFKVLGWRVVPVNPDVLGVQAKANQPRIEQAIVQPATPEIAQLDLDSLERELYLARRRIHNAVSQAVRDATTEPTAALQDFYICSLSVRTIVYKGMVRSAVLGTFYLDLQDPAYTSAFACYHRRFSTNTLPRWPLAQPMRLLGHNGEINTLLGNINWMMARQSDLEHERWGDRIDVLKPIVNPNASDSANLDNVFELLVQSGRSPLEALMVMVPEAYRNQPELADKPEITDFYEYYSGIQEPWDGPALLVFSDGKMVGATLDRNGLRPARYLITRDGLIIVSSEAGVVQVDEADIVEKGRLGPGTAIAVDLETHELFHNWEIKQKIARHQPYGAWLKQHRYELPIQPFLETPQLSGDELLRQQTAFGYTTEDVEMVIEGMAVQAKEPTFCMGDDAPLAILSEKARLLYDYFKQRFAQVTNPAIDPLRENLVMSLSMELGPRGNLLKEKPEFAHRIKVESPVLSEPDLQAIQDSDYKVASVSTLYPVSDGPQGLKDAVQRICQQAEQVVSQGNTIVILSDRLRPDTHADSAGQGVSETLTFVPPLVVIGAVHHHLIRQGLRMHVSLVVDTAQCWSTHHFACLIGYGASAVCPYLTWETIRQWWSSSRAQNMMDNGKLETISIDQAQANYREALNAGLFKILSKMGISLLASYHGAQIFEAIGIGPELLDLAFKGTTSRIGGLSITELAQEVSTIHQRAFPELTAQKLQNFGFVQYRKNGEYHMNNPEMVKALHGAVREKQYDHYEVYKQHLRSRPVTALRDLLDFKRDRPSISLDEVEPVEAIMTRFCTGGMSLGALSREAHETLAIAMNRIGGRSNSGEGGEDPTRFLPLTDVDEATGISPTMPHLHGLRNGDTANSAIKQVASGRFGVTPEYLMNANQIEIKLAQGAKPGEGGQLPGRKVSSYIATLRRSKPGVTLISPPPHHDIYSIEDLAQLIFDLHQINPEAKVSVKLVAEIGIGTIAAGVAKANADIIQISGHDGGTGASPLSSIKHAGTPWELGLTEVHRALMTNQLRDRVILRADGGLKSGWDVVMAALMGAEEFGFGSIAMIAEGCIMARVCHLNTCPVGVATQQEKLRQRFKGTPEQVVNFFYFVAEEIRSLLAHLGYHSLTELTGRADLLTLREDVSLTKTEAINLDCLLNLPDAKSDRHWLDHEPVHSNGPVLDDTILADAEVQTALTNQSGTVAKTYSIVNTDRTVGARIAGAIAKRHGNAGLQNTLALTFNGSAGQSFGAFNLPGMVLTLNGEANDYVGKGMNGGEIIIKPPTDAAYVAADNVIIGNTCLYGATGGILYANGQAGERFAVRNSKGQAVVEGAGDHCCEYMTGGVIVVLGSVGRNLGAGMTGGLAYILDTDSHFSEKVNPEIVSVQRVTSIAGAAQLKGLIQAHADRTQSVKALDILANWETYLPQFWQVVPPSEAETPEVCDPVTESEKVLTSV
ncbi:MAG: glutamate synthase-related protein [Leptolyngbyaceae bacterium]|nr:glutamate synthase-related protein [Leptolyngbyaceae bacterium]